MITDYKEKQRRSATLAKRIYNITLGVLIVTVGLLMLFYKQINNDTVTEYLDFKDPLLQNMFGGLCLLYGGFRLYRGIKKDY